MRNKTSAAWLLADRLIRSHPTLTLTRMVEAHTARVAVITADNELSWSTFEDK